jgi:hypothetical protein
MGMVAAFADDGTVTHESIRVTRHGRNIHWDAVDIFRLQGGKISAIWAGDDWSAILYYTGTYTAPWIY